MHYLRILYIQYHKTLWQIMLFGFVGVGTLLVDVGVTKLLYSSFGFSAVLSSAIGFLSGFFFNFPMNRKKVFHHADNDRFSLRAQVMQYVALSIFNLVATSFAVGFLTDTGIVAIQYAKVIVTAVFAVWNFVLFKFLIFSKKLIKN